MKRITISILILVLLLSSTIGCAYANKATTITYDDVSTVDILTVSSRGPFQKIGEVIDDTATNVIKSIGNTLQELIDYTISKFKDIKVSDWFVDTVSKLVGKGGIDGYPDGTFRPNNTMTKAEYTKTVVGSLGFREEGTKGKHWATNYMNKAEELKLIDKNEYPLKDYDKPITRNEAVKIAVRACEYLGEKAPSNYKEYKDYIKDYNSISSKYRDYVLKSMAIGLIDGYEDNTFRGSNNLTRAEASTIIIRITDKDERVNIKGNDDDFIEPEFEIRMTTDEMFTFNYFEFIVTNYQDYVDKDYTFITECISHPELNKRLVPDVFGEGYLESDEVEYYTMKSSRLLNQLPKGKIYELQTFVYDLNPETNKPFKLKNGEKLKYKVTVTNGKTTETYELETAFKNKEFF